MSTLSVGDLQGLAVNSNVVTVPTGHTLNAVDGLQIGGVAQGTWTAYTPTFTGISFSSYTARYAMVNKVVHVGFEGTLDAASTGTIYIGLPETPYLPNNDTRRWGAASCVDQSAGVYYSGLVELRSTGEVRIWDNVGGSSSAPRWDNLFPFTWASGDWLTFQITYEAA